MKTVIFNKKFLLPFLGFVSGLLVLAYFYSPSGVNRNPSSLSHIEIEYAEKFLVDEKSDSSNLDVAPAYQDSLEREVRYKNTIEDRIERAMETNYKEDLLKALKEHKGITPSRKNLEDYLDDRDKEVFSSIDEDRKRAYVEEFLNNARRDGWEITLDADYNIISTKAIQK